MRVKTSELKEKGLDFMVAKCVGTLGHYVQPNEKRGTTKWEVIPQTRRYSTNWAQGGPIIDGIPGFELKIWLESKAEMRCEAHIHNYEGDSIQFGPTPLVAAMRCLVALKMGEVVELPDELAL